MAKKITDEELEELNKKLKESATPQINENSYIAMLKNLGEKEGYDYVSDYNVIKNSLLQQSYSPRANKVYTYEEAQTLTPQQYYDDVMAAADHTESGNKVTNALKTFVYGANEAIGGTALYKAIKGEEALQQKANQVERVYGNNQVARGLGNIVGKTLLYTEGSLVGGLPGAAAAGAISEGGQAYTYSNDPATIAGAAERGALFGLVRGGVASSMKNAIANAVPSAMGNVGTNFLINAASQGTGAYAGNAFAGTASNIINAASGKEVTAKEWSKPFWSIEALANAGLSALIGGAINTAIDRAQINQLMTKDLNTMNEQANANAIRVEQALRSGNKVAADIFAKAEIDNIDKFTNNTYAGMKFNNTFKEQMMNDWMNSMSSLYSKYGYTIDYQPTLGTGTSSYGVTPNYASSNVPATTNSTSITPTVSSVGNSSNSSVTIPTNVSTATTQTPIVSNANEIYNNNQPNSTEGGTNNGRQLQTNNTTGVAKIERDGTNQLSDESLDEIYQRVKANYEDTRKADEIAKKNIIKDLTEEETNDLKSLTDEFGTPVYYANLKDVQGTSQAGFATQDGIYIDKDEAQNYGLKNIAWHEMAEDLLLNHTDIAGKDITKLVKLLKDTDKVNHVATKLMDNLFKESSMTNAEKRKFVEKAERYTKELLFNAYSADKQFGKNNPYREIMGDELYNTTINTLDALHNEAKGKPKVHLESLNGSNTNELGSGLPEFAKTKGSADKNKNLTIEKQNKDIEKLEKANDNLRNKAVEEKEKSKAKLRKNAEKSKEREKQIKEKSKDKINKLKAKNKEDVKDAKEKARATTTDKKLRLSLNRLDKALNNVYDKPRSAETEKALDTVRKQTRGTIKLIDKVKTKLPSRYNFFADDVLDIIDSYYTGGNTMTDEKRASLIKKSEAIEKFAKEHPEYPISKKALDLLKEPSKKNIADLNEKDLISLAEDLQEIGTAVRDMFSFTRATEDAVKLRNEAIDFARERLERGEGRNYNNLQSNKALNTIVELGENYVDKRSTIQTLTTALSGGDPNSPFNFIPKQLANGYDRYNRAMEKMLKLFDKYVDVKKLGNVRYYDNKLNDIFDPKKTLDVGLKTTNGETYKPTIRDAISVVLGAKDPQFANHTIGVVTDKIKDGKPLLSEGGTAVFSNNIDEKFGRIDKGLKRGVKVKLEASDIQKLEKALEDYPIVKDLMKTYKELTDLSFELTNESYEAINGMSLEKRDYYFPISNDPATRQRQNISDKLKGFNGQDASTTLLNTSIVKPVVEGANGQILIYPIDSVINKLIDNAALYNGYATALYDINTFLSAVSDDGEHLTELINHLDPSYLTNYGKITNALVGNTKPGGKMSSKLGGNYTESILKANFWLALKQAGSYFTAAPFYNHATRSLMAGLFNRGKMAQIIKDYYKDQGIDISKLGNSETLKYFWDDKVNAELSTRTRGYSTLDKKRLLKHTGLLERIDAFDWFKSVDIATINSLAWAMFNDMLLDTNIETDSFMNDLGARYIDAMTSTQPNPSVVTRAPIQVDGNILDKALSYMADPRIKNANALATARMRYKYSKKFGDEEEQKKYGSAYGKIALGTLASLAYITLVSRTKQDAEGKKKETTFWQDMIGNVFGLTIGMEQIAGKFLNDYSFDVSLPDTQALNLIFNFGEDAMKIFSSDNPEKYIDKAIQDLSGFLGIPYKNLKNDYNALTNLFDKETFYKNKIKADSNMYKKYQKFEDEIYNYREFYELYQATREKVVKENYGAYNNQNIKQAIEDYGADLETYYKMFKK